MWDALADARALAVTHGYAVAHIEIDRLNMVRARAVSAQLKQACADLDWASQYVAMREAAKIDLIGWRRGLSMNHPRTRAIVVVSAIVLPVILCLILINC